MKKGFTLIELLAVIVILAIIALIATPIVIDIISDTKESAALRSAEFYLDGVEFAVATAKLNNKTITNGTYNILENGNICLEYGADSKCTDELKVEVNGEKPKVGSIRITNGEIKEASLALGNNIVSTNTKGELVLSDKNAEVKLAPGLYDENNKLIASWEDLTSTEYKSFTYYDYNIEEEVTSAILNVDENGVLTSPYNEDDDVYYSVEYLVGKLVIDNSVISIGEYAFYGFTGLTSITIEEGVTSIGQNAFGDCIGLTSITIPDSVTSIGNEAFVNCESLTSITIPSSVKSIDNSAFRGCSSLTSIKVDTDNKVYDSRNNSNAIIETSTNTLIVSCKNTTIPDSVTSIGPAAFSGCSSLTSITIPDSVISIGEAAFSGCSSLTTITIPSSVTSIGNSVFNGCSSLTSVTIPSGVTSIGNFAFSRCSSLTTITIPSSVTSIGFDAFSGCSSLTSITIPSGVTSIGSYAFSRCSSLTTINYTGTEANWNAISKGSYWDLNTPSNKVINYNYTG